jgi:hypothetical protein
MASGAARVVHRATALTAVVVMAATSVGTMVAGATYSNGVYPVTW